MKRDSIVALEHWLHEWARWARNDRREIERMCGYKSFSIGFSTGGASSVDAFDEQADASELQTIMTIDRCINRLPMQYQAAIMNRWLAAVWRHRGDPEAVLSAAMDALASSVMKGGVVL